MTWNEKIIKAHLEVTDKVKHSEQMKANRYFVWQEDGENQMFANDRLSDSAVTGTSDLFTKQEFDPWKKLFEAALDKYGIAWYLNSVQYENETGFFHYEWVWEVA